ncbi:MAG TPA: hypothetical protein VFJ46_17635 [Xanthobacteraceae bacterium]|nr:hypothetical protein [Xanthobacteraceae bacterium]
MSDSIIIMRMDVAIDRARSRYPESKPQWFYLTEEDWDDFDAAKSAEWGSQVHCFSHRDITIRRGETSRLLMKGGCMVSVPKRLSPRVKAAA